jgi:hypothetical protein
MICRDSKDRGGLVLSAWRLHVKETAYPCGKPSRLAAVSTTVDGARTEQILVQRD